MRKGFFEFLLIGLLVCSFFALVYLGTVRAFVNYAPVTEWTMNPVADSSGDWSYSYLDDTVTHNGHTSICLTGGGTDGLYHPREVNREWSGGSFNLPTLVAGDEVYFGAWIKTAVNTTGNDGVHLGARIGVDFWSSSSYSGGTLLSDGWIDGVAYDCQDYAVPTPMTEVTSSVVADWFVEMDSDWTYVDMEFTVPTGAWGDTDGEHSHGQIQGMCLWFAEYSGYQANGSIYFETGNVWISDIVCTVNEAYTPPDDVSVEFYDGWETGFFSSEWDLYFETLSASNYSVVSSPVVSGSYAGLFGSVGTTATQGYFENALTSSYNYSAWFNVYFDAGLPTSGSHNFIQFRGVSTDIASLRVNTDGDLELYFADGDSGAGHYGNDTSFDMVVDTWYLLRLDVYVHDSAGCYTVYNGTLTDGVYDWDSCLSKTGLDTNDYGNVTMVRLGENYAYGTVSVPSHITVFDELYVNEVYVDIYEEGEEEPDPTPPPPPTPTPSPTPTASPAVTTPDDDGVMFTGVLLFLVILNVVMVLVGGWLLPLGTGLVSITVGALALQESASIWFSPYLQLLLVMVASFCIFYAAARSRGWVSR